MTLDLNKELLQSVVKATGASSQSEAMEKAAREYLKVLRTRKQTTRAHGRGADKKH
jgi:Arc/MetJ family transcription regulator